MLEDRLVGEGDGVPHNQTDFPRAHALADRPFDLAHENLSRQTAGHVARLRAPHAVADHQEELLRAEAHDVIIILVLLADVAGVRQSPCFHSVPSSSPAYFLRNCPQEASMSPPRLRRTVAVTPARSKIS